ncbi:TOTE conflict system archaeo-eukaryotic primase domain-containing protein [Robertmurraya mangrovi]|nr:helix-turn-helix domain-containing protein [Bacillus sp. 31A1R]
MDKYVKRINELYITNRNKYLIMFPNGKYITAGKYASTKNKKPLVDTDIISHLKGEKTFGVFAGEKFTKFICFDVDVIDNSLSRWHVYKVVQALIESGIPEDRIYLSLSGSKGYHIEIFFNEVISNKQVIHFFNMTMDRAGYIKSEEYAYMCEGGKIELRPVGNNLGVKLPLGKHFNTKTKKRCWYVDITSMKEIRRKSYISKIEQIDKSILDIIFERENDLTLEDTAKDYSEFVDQLKDAIQEHYKTLSIYKQNIDLTITYEAIKKLEEEGLKSVGTRHNALFKLAKLYRYEGANEAVCESKLISWLNYQDTKSYTTRWEDCLKDIKQIVKYVYEKEVSLTLQNMNVTIYEEELQKIIKLPKSCQKLISFALLVHSKRFASLNGDFYMSQKQIAEATGYNERTVRRELDVLEEHGIFNYVKRNQKIINGKGQFVHKKPNVYKMNINYKDTGKVDIKRYSLDISDSREYSLVFKKSLLNIYSLDELKKVLPIRMYNDIRRYKLAS